MGVNMRFEGGGLRPFTMQLERFEDNVRSARPAFDAMADHQAEVMKQQFAAQGGVRSGPWESLSPRYEAWKSKRFPGQPIMVRSGELRSSLTQRPFGVDQISDRGMTIGTDVPYAKYHQHGTGDMPKRQLIGDPSVSDKKVWAKILQEWIVEQRLP